MSAPAIEATALPAALLALRIGPVLARGTRHTETIAAGAIGNDGPIEIVAEEWFSPDIEAVVLRRNFDPRFGAEGSGARQVNLAGALSSGRPA